MTTAMILELIIGAIYGMISLYACLKLALMIRPSRRKGWSKLRAYLLTGMLLLGAIISAVILAQVVYFIL